MEKWQTHTLSVRSPKTKKAHNTSDEINGQIFGKQQIRTSNKRGNGACPESLLTTRQGISDLYQAVSGVSSFWPTVLNDNTSLVTHSDGLNTRQQEKGVSLALRPLAPG
ncbi:hypothetical protein RRG08_024500 [Elysia crispata]|uniref:Uncharacterized protein n=1 Tax=Elysia crispata TaxID=231223 RepID=A0AAE1D295_9GAST|nr:hypothetical protein RRG08_024500 [Elysia crispata]